jgi:ribonuclease T1
MFKSDFRALHLVFALLLIIGGGGLEARDSTTDPRQPANIAIAHLPPEARTTLRLIEFGGPFPYAKDGSTFGNRERRLPPKPRDYYREYTVPTPGSPDRGARVVTGGGGERYYRRTITEPSNGSFHERHLSRPPPRRPLGCVRAEHARSRRRLSRVVPPQRHAWRCGCTRARSKRTVLALARTWNCRITSPVGTRWPAA